MSVIYCKATDDYVDTDYVLMDQHAFESHHDANDCCEGGEHAFEAYAPFQRVEYGPHCQKCGLSQEQLAEWNEEAVTI